MEEHIILSEHLEEQLKAVEWARAEQKRLLKEKGEQISMELMKENDSIYFEIAKGVNIYNSCTSAL